MLTQTLVIVTAVYILLAILHVESVQGGGEGGLHRGSTPTTEVTFLSWSVAFIYFAYGTYSKRLTGRVSGKVKPTT